MALGVGSGIQLNNASCASNAFSPDVEFHQVAGVKPEVTGEVTGEQAINSTDLRMLLEVYTPPRCTDPSGDALGVPPIWVSDPF